MLYGAAWRAARALGYTRLITYTQDGESGSSLRAVGFVRVAKLRAAGVEQEGTDQDTGGDAAGGVALEHRGVLRGVDGQPSAPLRAMYAGGKPWRRSNFRQRYWRPAWDGQNMDDPCADDHIPAILPWFTFNEGRHTHATWLAEDGIPEVARRARLGQKMKGIARVYDHVTPAMRRMILDVLETRWLSSLAVLTLAEQTRLVSWFPHVQTTLDDLQGGAVRKLMSAKYPHDH